MEKIWHVNEVHGEITSWVIFTRKGEIGSREESGAESTNMLHVKYKLLDVKHLKITQW